MAKNHRRCAVIGLNQCLLNINIAVKIQDMHYTMLYVEKIKPAFAGFTISLNQLF